ncbi:galactoside-binding lectin [Teladorsagia circumcincta]|uniref:Galectin n=1 Tax=Teladorsagia circumcincta TaxID=45464 RepID=A0A2G9TKV2_TELCI|nr:galactoside-binding lectin [Teladorsagia circumcincta]
MPKRRITGNISEKWITGSHSRRVSVKHSLLDRLFMPLEPLVINRRESISTSTKVPPKTPIFHCIFRFDLTKARIFSGKFVYNTFKDGNWSENEQRISNPFKAGQEFDLRVRILEGKFQVFANRVEVGTFEQRQPLDGIDHVSIRGDLVKLRLFHYGGRIFPNPYMAVAELKPGKRLDISALPTGKRVNINLYRENKEFALQVR